VLRLPVSVVVAVGVTLGLFTLMRVLVEMTEMRLDDAGRRKVIDFVRLKRESQTEVKKRELPTRQRPEAPPEAPKMQMSSGGGPGALAVSTGGPQFDTGLNLKGGLNLGPAPADTEAVPVVRVEPIYPRQAAERQVEGWVTMQFDIGPSGSVQNVRVIGEEPKGVFGPAAVAAVKKWKYKPKVIDGKALVTKGVKVRLTFNLGD
jgi:protein TonB